MMYISRRKGFIWGLLICFFLVGGSTDALARVNYYLNIEPETAENANPECWMVVWNGFGWGFVGTIQDGGSLRLDNFRTYALLVPDISGTTGCGLPTNKTLSDAGGGWYYFTFNSGNRDISDRLDYDCPEALYYRDADGDGYGDPNDTVTSPQSGYVEDNTDCDDNDANEYPGQTWYADLDGDGYGDGTQQTACERPGSHNLLTELTGLGDCNDSDNTVNPGEAEVCDDGIDNNCDGNIDEDCPTTFYLDADSDGYGDPANTISALVQPDGYVEDDSEFDCNDNDYREFPGQTWYADLDGDGYSDGTNQTACLRPANYFISTELTAISGDCDDTSAARNPGAAELCGDGVDQDCSGNDAVCLPDVDNDGYPDAASGGTDCDDNDATVHPGAVEIFDDGIDQDCDGSDSTALDCIEISNIPLDSQLAASAPNLMFGLDDSGSMDWEIMTAESAGLFNVGGRDYEYIFDNPGDNLYTSGTNSHILYDEGKQAYWKSQWHGYNVIYYNPAVDYIPWYSMGNADPDNPRSHPYYAANYFALGDTFVTASGVTIPNAHYYAYSESEAKIYLVIVDDGSIDYYKVNDNDGYVGYGELVSEASPPSDVVTGRTYAEERQNFANWYSYYRKRRSTAVAAISNVIPKLQGVMVGFRSINAHILQKVLAVNVGGVDHTSDLLDKLYAYHPGTHTIGSTPIRKGLQKIGQYYHVNESISPSETELSVSPLAAGSAGECQQNFAIMFTDGSYNGQSPGLGNVDDGKPDPYGDDASNTLADVAYYYWEEDLNPNLDNNVPTNFYDNANWQHMVTYTVGFGLEGNLDPDDYDLTNIVAENRVYPTWPSPINSDKERIDDLWHAAVNGRGLYLNAKTPQELIAAFEKVVSDVLARIGSGASVSINGEELQEGLVLYQSIYSTARWTGDVVAHNVDETTGAVLETSPWAGTASEVMDTALAASADAWDTGRVIATYDNDQNPPTGVAFRFANLGATHKATLTSSDMVEYIRGKHTLEEHHGGSYRSRYIQDDNGNYVRDTVLADVVHSAPLYYKNMVFVGGNDGMLHAYDSNTGTETFAYIPDLVFDNLDLLIDPNYTHRYFVDLTPYAKEITSGGTTKDLLIGGLGKGGKGYYCLDITNGSTAITSEAALVYRVAWEYPNANTPAAEVNDMGYSFSRAIIANTTNGWVAVFGNGYNSPTNDAVLYVVNAETGALIKKISTNSTSGCNGLASPLLVDVDADTLLDYVYAGDLQGNLWKFDFTDANTANWDVAYKSGSTPKPLFQAKDAFGNSQPITIKPDAIFHCDGSLPGYIVVFGTGKYLGSTDLTDTSQQTLYAVWDYGADEDDSEYLGTFNRSSATKLSNQPDTVSLLEQTVDFQGDINNVTYRVLSDNTITWLTELDASADDSPNPSSTQANHAGWYFDLPDSKERVVRDLVVRGGKAIVITSIPTTGSPCVAGGESYLMEMDACNGARLTTAQLDINDDGKVDENDVIMIPDPGGGDDPIPVPPTGPKFPTMMFPPMIIDNPNDNTEIKYFSTSAGNVIVQKEQDEGVGRQYWREVD